MPQHAGRRRHAESNTRVGPSGWTVVPCNADAPTQGGATPASAGVPDGHATSGDGAVAITDSSKPGETGRSPISCVSAAVSAVSTDNRPPSSKAARQSHVSGPA